MTTFIQLHLLTAYPAANLNRDDTGAPKTVVLGGATRLRVSSQSLKRAWRTSELFEQALAGNIGIRSGRIAREAANILIEKGIDAKKAVEWVEGIANCFGKVKADKKAKDVLTNAETEQLVHISPAEFEAVKALAHRLAEEKRAPKEEELALLRKDRMAVDIAMFGRMLANKPEFNVEAACQVAHAFGVSETIGRRFLYRSGRSASGVGRRCRGGAPRRNGIRLGAVLYLHLHRQRSAGEKPER